MKNIRLLLFFLILTLSCKEDADLSSLVEGLGGDKLNKLPIDTWLFENFTKPFNIEVKYRWDPFEVPLDKTLVPPLISRVQPAMEAVKKIWIDPYVKVAGEDFVKRFCPKQYILVGSANWNIDGTITLGTAEGGRKVVLYQLNDFDKRNVPVVKEMMHTIHHEFAHILHQNVLYPVSYRQITPGSYTSNWYNISEEEALNLGYVSSYAMLNPDEDFVEMIATLLVDGQALFNERLATLNNNPEAREALLKKQQLVIDYFQKTYNINFKTLQSITQTEIANFTK
jgi:substrate import-associated zinc metallohydrolase lipoprotein